MKSAWRLPALVLGMLLSAVAVAQLRSIPAGVERGIIRHIQGPMVSIDGRSVQLPPGATIRGQDNLIIVPSALPADGALAEYQVDGSGNVTRVWLLSPEEAARKPTRR